MHGAAPRFRGSHKLVTERAVMTFLGGRYKHGMGNIITNFMKRFAGSSTDAPIAHSRRE
jgi:hypothetical protein